MSDRVYLDHNATAQLRPEARSAMELAIANSGNPSSVHEEGRKAHALLEEARESVASLAGVAPRQVIFTSGGTEANVTALSPLNVNKGTPEKSACFISAIEHPSVIAGGRFAPEQVQQVGVTQDGVIDVAALEEAIAEQVERAGETGFMVSLMLANNETGVIQPVSRVAEIVRSHGGVLHCDAIQAFGKVSVDVRDTGAHMTSVTAHKLGGPKGAGALILGEDFASLPSPLLSGGGQELRARAGTENVIGICGFGAAAKAAGQQLDRFAELGDLRDRLESKITAMAPESRIYGREAARLPNTSCFAVPGLLAETLVIALDLAGIAISSGSACSSGKVEASHVLTAMGADDIEGRSAIRVSLGWNTSERDVDAFIAAWSKQYEQHTKQSAAA